MKKTWMFALLIIIGALIACGASDTNTNTGTAASSGNPTSAATPTTAPAKHWHKGDVVKVGGIWNITVNDVRASNGGDYETPKAGNVYLVISVTVVNASKQEQTLASGYNFSLKDTDGQSYDSTFVSVDNIKNPPDGKVEPGDKAAGDLTYEVPASKKTFKLAFQNNAFESGQTIWDLTD